jgi:hypothetical protein
MQKGLFVLLQSEDGSNTIFSSAFGHAGFDTESEYINYLKEAGYTEVPLSTYDVQPAIYPVFPLKDKTMDSFEKRAAELEQLTAKSSFRVGGVPHTVYMEYKELISEYTKQKKSLEHQKEVYNTLRDTYRNTLGERDILQVQLDNLKRVNFSFERFDVWCAKLYKTLGMSGPKVRSKDDLPTLIDALYNHLNRAVEEEELP